MQVCGFRVRYRSALCCYISTLEIVQRNFAISIIFTAQFQDHGNLAVQFRNCVNLAMNFEIGLQFRNCVNLQIAQNIYTHVLTALHENCDFFVCQNPQ